MKTIRLMVFLGGWVLVAAACGHKGPVMAPLTREPKRVESLSAAQKGKRILLNWTAPGVYIDDRSLPESAVYEIWLLRNDAAESALESNAAAGKSWSRAFRLAVLDIYGRPFNEKAVASAGPEPTKPQSEFTWALDIAPDDWKAASLTFGVRVIAGKRDVSGFVYTGCRPKVLPAAPGNLRAAVFSDRIEIQWSVPETNADGTGAPQLKGYNVYRQSPGQDPVLLNITPAPMPIFMDVSFEFEQRYTYRVAAMTGDDAPYVESELSAPIEVAPVDIFPPAAPKNLQSLTAVGLVTLIWEAVTESDLAGYRVWRQRDDEKEFKSLTPNVITENTFSDDKIERGHRYSYAVTAVDLKGNESPRSEALSEFIKEDRP